MMPQEDQPLLVAQDGPLKGQRWQLGKPIVLGREPSCDVVITDRQISRFHARLTPTTEGVILEDLGSKNGTLLNELPLSRPTSIEPGDIIGIGDLRLVLEAGAE